MYEYRKLSPEERQKLVQERLARGYPPHQPPHPIREQTFYLLTAAGYEHRHHLHSPERRQTVLDLVFEQFIQHGMDVRAWAVLTNHYHLLVYVNEFEALKGIFQQIHGPTSLDWNQADKAQGRKMWYRYSDRVIRSERHYYTTLNYIHYNPVKHGGQRRLMSGCGVAYIGTWNIMGGSGCGICGGLIRYGIVGSTGMRYNYWFVVTALAVFRNR